MLACDSSTSVDGKQNTWTSVLETVDNARTHSISRRQLSLEFDELVQVQFYDKESFEQWSGGYHKLLQLGNVITRNEEQSVKFANRIIRKMKGRLRMINWHGKYGFPQTINNVEEVRAFLRDAQSQEEVAKYMWWHSKYAKRLAAGNLRAYFALAVEEHKANTLWDFSIQKQQELENLKAEIAVLKRRLKAEGGDTDVEIAGDDDLDCVINAKIDESAFEIRQDTPTLCKEIATPPRAEDSPIFQPNPNHRSASISKSAKNVGSRRSCPVLTRPRIMDGIGPQDSLTAIRFSTPQKVSTSRPMTRSTTVVDVEQLKIRAARVVKHLSKKEEIPAAIKIQGLLLQIDEAVQENIVAQRVPNSRTPQLGRFTDDLVSFVHAYELKKALKRTISDQDQLEVPRRCRDNLYLSPTHTIPVLQLEETKLEESQNHESRKPLADITPRISQQEIDELTVDVSSAETLTDALSHAGCLDTLDEGEDIAIDDLYVDELDQMDELVEEDELVQQDENDADELGYSENDTAELKWAVSPNAYYGLDELDAFLNEENSINLTAAIMDEILGKPVEGNPDAVPFLREPGPTQELTTETCAPLGPTHEDQSSTCPVGISQASSNDPTTPLHSPSPSGLDLITSNQIPDITTTDDCRFAYSPEPLSTIDEAEFEDLDIDSESEKTLRIGDGSPLMSIGFTSPAALQSSPSLPKLVDNSENGNLLDNEQMDAISISDDIAPIIFRLQEGDNETEEIQISAKSVPKISDKSEEIHVSAKSVPEISESHPKHSTDQATDDKKVEERASTVLIGCDNTEPEDSKLVHEVPSENIQDQPSINPAPSTVVLSTVSVNAPVETPVSWLCKAKLAFKWPWN